MKITRIDQKNQGTNGAKIYINGNFYTELSVYTVKKLQLREGQEINEQVLQEAILETETERAKTYVARYQAGNTRKRIEEALEKKGFSPEVRQQVMRFLEAYGYVNDVAYAQKFVQESVAHKKRGKGWIRQELERKGVTEAEAEQALCLVTEQEEIEAAVKTLQTKQAVYQKTSKKEEEFRARCFGYLQQRGYDSEIAEQAVNRIAIKKTDEE